MALVLALAGNVQAGTISLTWDANTEPDVLGYWVFYGTQPGLYTNAVDAGEQTSATIYGLAGDVVYYFTVQAYNGYFSLPSNEVNGSTTNEAPALGANLGDQTSLEGTEVSLARSIDDPDSDPDGDPLIYSAVNLPAGLAIDSISGLISGTISYTAAGSHSVTVTASDGWLSGGETFTWTVTDVNAPPTLQEPGNLSDFVGDPVSVQLLGSDVDGQTLTYSAVGLPPGLILDPVTGLISGSPTTHKATPYTVTASVTDGTLEDGQIFTWTVPNRAPIVESPLGDQSTPEGTAVSLQVIASDPDGDTLFYAGNLPPQMGLSLNPSTGLITGTPSFTSEGIYAVTLFVLDSSFRPSPFVVLQWTIVNTNRPPTITSPGDQTGTEGDVVALPIVASDPDGTPLTYGSTGLPAGLTIHPNTGVVSGMLSYMSEGSHTVTISASDGTETTTTPSFTWTVIGANGAPVLTTPHRSDAEGAVISGILTAADPDGDVITAYTATGLPPGLSLDPATGVITGTLDYTTAGIHIVNISASDGTLTTNGSVNWTVTNINTTPALTNPGDQSSAEGVTIPLLQLLGGDVDGDTLSYSATGLPSGLSLHPNSGLITGTLSYASAGTHAVTLTITDGTTPVSQPIMWTVIDTNTTPALTNPGDQASAEGAIVSRALLASDVDGDTLTFSATGLPSGLSVHPTTGVVTGTLSYASEGTHPVTLTVTDGTTPVTQAINWTVANVNRAPMLAAPANQATVASCAVSLALSASDPDGTSVIYSATNLPPGLSVNSASGVISGTMTSDLGSYMVTVTVSDGSLSDSKTFNWTVATAVAASFLTDRTDAAGAAVMLVVTSSDSGGNPLTYTATDLPDGLDITGVPPAWRIVGVNDVNGDTQSDLVWRETQTGGVGLWLLDGPTASPAPDLASGIPLAWKIVGTGDLDGDGKADLVWRHAQSGDVAAWLMDGVNVKGGPLLAGGVLLEWQIVGMGDLDGDGKTDLVWRHTQSGDVAAWLMDGASIRQGPRLSAGVALEWQIHGVGDLDGDGKADLLWRHAQSGNVAAWLMDGGSIRQGPLISAAVPLAWQIVGLKDVDGDHKADVVWRHMQTRRMAMWLMNGVEVTRILGVD